MADRTRVGAAADRTRVGVVGCGLIAQVMHLPYLTELSDRFEVAALCDIREPVAAGCAQRFGVPRAVARWEDLLEERLDAVLVATSGASFVNQVADLLEQWPDGTWEPDFATGLEVQAGCEAIERAAAERRWVALDEVRRGLAPA